MAQRFILDEDCVFLLCSDGLSDFDRIEQYWETEILPLLNHKGDVASVTKQLLEIANNQNGHDNVTIALMHCQTKYSEPKSALVASLADISSISAVDSLPLAPATQNLPNQKTQVITEKVPRKGFNLPLMLGIIALLTIVGSALGYFWRQKLLSKNLDSPLVAQTNTSTLNPEASEKSFNRKDIDEGWLISAKTKITNLSKSTTPPPVRDVSAKQPLPIYAPPGSLLEVVQKQPISSEDYWLQIKVCSIGEEVAANLSAPKSTSTGSKTSLKPGEQVWLKGSQLTPSNTSFSKPTTVPNQCSTPDSSFPRIEDSSTSSPVEDSQNPSEPLTQPSPGSIPGLPKLPQTGNSTDSKTR